MALVRVVRRPGRAVAQVSSGSCFFWIARVREIHGSETMLS